MVQVPSFALNRPLKELISRVNRRFKTTTEEDRPLLRKDFVKELLNGISQIGATESDLLPRRQATLELLMQILGADFGHWAWGVGDRTNTKIAPLALLTAGYSDHDKGMFMQFAMAPETESTFRRPILDRMGADQQITLARCEIFSESTWPSSFMRQALLPFGGDEWLHTVRYETTNIWSNMFLIRRRDSPEFDSAEVALLDVAIDAIPWLHGTAQEIVPTANAIGLTDRQRTVMLLLMDGSSRKMIATQLGISDDTVGDHIKNIYQHFKINSVSELAAVFLRNK